ncbi:NAD(P)/FAD-dependent oxidoreductase [Thiohalophilus sp.]|uniref:NAD(P)/FAD-dependent oxidoreductase n=1 Tax=Thiohalophilus sp. TaxID=3028392 RepID=UPI002ACE331A|nr:NAD(P)/FAD-dependent oxidoreductase [Thiohalophilus sp.]MDZ7804718.1 NAD(P)/FAD-dependent oxidoreductase [Thiohalophilus sp.]
MNRVNRRQFIQLLGGAGVLASSFGLTACSKQPTASGRVVIIGGGFGGATCAKYLQRFDPNLDITLVEPKQKFVTCPFSNLVLGGMRNIDSISHSYQAHEQRGIKVVHAMAQEIDPTGKKVTLNNGSTLEYDRLVVSPGIDFRWEDVEGMSDADVENLPHAWNGGPQTTILRKQLTDMPDGGTVIIAPPANPFRCPPGPYERASMIANYLKQNKPKSKVLILDAKTKFSKQPLFMQGWEQLYGDMIEWVSGDAGGRVSRVDVAGKGVYNELGESFSANVVNFIPPQKAGKFAHDTGLVDNTGWCPVNQRTFESTLHPDIHVIGDAALAGAMPKSGFAANSQGKVCAAAIVSALHGTRMPQPSYVNTCYSLVGPDYGISVAAVYRYAEDQGIYKVDGSGGVSPADADAEFRQKEARYTRGWYASITSDTWG